MAVNYKQRQAYMRSLGYKVPLDDSWGGLISKKYGID